MTRGVSVALAGTWGVVDGSAPDSLMEIGASQIPARVNL